MSASPAQDPDDRTSLRDAGLRRIRDTRRWLAGGAVVLTGAFAGIAAQTTPGAASTTGSTGSSVASGATSTDSGATLQAPSEAPQSSAAAPQASSGAS